MKLLVHPQSIQAALNIVKMALEVRFGQPIEFNSLSVKEIDTTLPNFYRRSRRVSFRINYCFQASWDIHVAKGDLLVEEYTPTYRDGKPTRLKRWNLGWVMSHFEYDGIRLWINRMSHEASTPGIRTESEQPSHQWVGRNFHDRQLVAK